MDQGGYTYLIRQGDYLKIGYTTDVIRRLKSYGTHNAAFELLYYISGNVERELHNKFSGYRYKNEWFRYSDEIVAYFRANGYSYMYYYVGIDALSNIVNNISGNALRLLIRCMAYSDRDGVFKINADFKEFVRELKVLSNLNMYLNELIKHGCIFRIGRGVYGINSKIAYCGALYNNANLSLKVFSNS